MSPSIGELMLKELTTLAPSTLEVKVVAPSVRLPSPAARQRSAINRRPLSVVVVIVAVEVVAKQHPFPAKNEKFIRKCG